MYIDLWKCMFCLLLPVVVGSVRSVLAVSRAFHRRRSSEGRRTTSITWNASPVPCAVASWTQETSSTWWTTRNSSVRPTMKPPKPEVHRHPLHLSHDEGLYLCIYLCVCMYTVSVCVCECVCIVYVHCMAYVCMSMYPCMYTYKHAYVGLL